MTTHDLNRIYSKDDKHFPEKINIFQTPQEYNNYISRLSEKLKIDWDPEKTEETTKKILELPEEFDYIVVSSPKLTGTLNDEKKSVIVYWSSFWRGREPPFFFPGTAIWKINDIPVNSVELNHIPDIYTVISEADYNKISNNALKNFYRQESTFIIPQKIGIDFYKNLIKNQQRSIQKVYDITDNLLKENPATNEIKIINNSKQEEIISILTKCNYYKTHNDFIRDIYKLDIGDDIYSFLNDCFSITLEYRIYNTCILPEVEKTDSAPIDFGESINRIKTILDIDTRIKYIKSWLLSEEAEHYKNQLSEIFSFIGLNNVIAQVIFDRDHNGEIIRAEAEKPELMRILKKSDNKYELLPIDQ